MSIAAFYDEPRVLYIAGTATVAMQLNSDTLLQDGDQTTDARWLGVHLVVVEVAPNHHVLLAAVHVEDSRCANPPEAVIHASLDESFEWSHCQISLAFRCTKGSVGRFYLQFADEAEFWELAQLFVASKLEVAARRRIMHDVLRRAVMNFPMVELPTGRTPSPSIDEMDDTISQAGDDDDGNDGENAVDEDHAGWD
ncbi:hypothetical protein OH77DRAFT_1517326 [Trametes cingulata]|nr:hypothetical protein OH77DRAFT_1517326 [Trametes cingulata]